MRTLIIIPYFGRFPSFFQDFLNSCKFNKSFNWLIITDDYTNYDFPINVKVIYDSFPEFVSKIQSRFDFKIEIKRPHKLCDFKVAYGYIFNEEIAGYDYWGHGDLDVIYGDLNKFLNPLMNEGYDKIYSLGHLSIYKNNLKVNTAFKSNINGKDVYKYVFTNDFGYAFDEWHCRLGSINDIFKTEGFKFYEFNQCANLDSQFSGFKLSNYIINFGNYSLDTNYQNVFKFNNGKLYRYFINFDKIHIAEYPYLHMHKRSISRKCLNYNEYLIVPNFIIKDIDIKISDIKKFSKPSFINYQFFKVKYINIRYRFKQLIK
jgi:hypothetical protein